MHCSDLPIESCPNFASPGLVPAPPRPCPAPFRLGSSGRLPLYPAPPRPAPPCPAPPPTAPLCLTSVSPSVLLASESGRRGGPDSSYSYLRIWTVHDDSQGSYAPCMTAVLCVTVAYHCIHTAVPHSVRLWLRRRFIFVPPNLLGGSNLFTVACCFAIRVVSRFPTPLRIVPPLPVVLATLRSASHYFACFDPGRCFVY